LTQILGTLALLSTVYVTFEGHYYKLKFPVTRGKKFLVGCSVDLLTVCCVHSAKLVV